MGGVSYLFFLRKLVDDIETGWDGVHAALERIRTTLLDRVRHAVQRHRGCGGLASHRAAARRIPRRTAARCGKACAVARRRHPARRRARHPGEGQLCRQGRRPLSRRRQAERQPHRGAPLSAHQLPVGQDPGAGRRLWRPMHVRPLLRRLHLRVVSRSQPAGLARRLRPHRRFPPQRRASITPS